MLLENDIPTHIGDNGGDQSCRELSEVFSFYVYWASSQLHPPNSTKGHV